MRSRVHVSNSETSKDVKLIPVFSVAKCSLTSVAQNEIISLHSFPL